MNTGLQVFDTLSDDLRQEALTHASYTNEDREGGPNNERLEFLGDALLKESKEILEDLIVAAHNDAKSKIKKKTSEEISKATGGINFPPGFKLPF